MQRIKHKVGDTFNVAGIYKDSAGDPVNLTTAGITVASAMRDSSNKLYEATTVILDQSLYPGHFQVNRHTTDWPVDDEMTWDVQFTRGSIVTSTETVTIITEADVTPTA